MSNQSELERRARLFDKEAEKAVMSWCEEKKKKWIKFDQKLEGRRIYV